VTVVASASHNLHARFIDLAHAPGTHPAVLDNAHRETPPSDVVGGISGLVTSRDAVGPGALVRDVADRFFREPDLDAVAIVGRGLPLGLLTRSRLLVTLARNFGHELFARKPVTRVGDLEPLVLPGSTSVQDAVTAALGRRAEAVYDEVIVTRPDGRYDGLLSMRRLVLEQGMVVVRSALEREAALTRAADLERLEQARSRFLAHATHELRSPVNAIVMLGELVRLACDKRSWEEIQARVPHLLRTAASLRATVGAMLDLSKLEAGRHDVVAAQVDLGALATEVAATTRLLASGKPIAVECAVPGAGELQVTTDAQKLKQICTNLASNAAKFTDEGRIEVGAAREPRGGARLWVTDTGIGIQPEDVDRLFQPFSQLEAAETKAHAGTGLGLAISRSLATLVGATISVESRPGLGSTFTVHLPETCPEPAHP
jgi:signal transduction histidine kinase